MIYLIFIILLLAIPVRAEVLTYGPSGATCYTTQQSGTSALIVVPDDVSNPETAVENNTNTTVLIKAGTYSVTNFAVNTGNFVAAYNCQNAIIDISARSDWTADDWRVEGLHFDCTDNSSQECIRIRGGATDWGMYYNWVDNARSALYLDGDMTNGVVQGNIFESLPGTGQQSDLVRVGGSGAESGNNLLVTQNWFRSNLGTNNDPDGGNDMVSVNGNDLTNVVLTDNYFTNLRNYEQVVDFKNSTVAIEFSYNTMIGPFTGYGSDGGGAPGAPCIIVGDSTTCGGTDTCPQHLVHHNYGESCSSNNTGLTGQAKRSGGFGFGINRYSRTNFDHNVDNNNQTNTSTLANRRLDTGFHRQSTIIKSFFRFNGAVCTDQTTGGFTYQALANAFDLTDVPDGCTGTPDWNWQDNVFSDIAGGGIDGSRLGTGNTTTTITFGGGDAQTLAVSGAGALDFTISTSAESAKGALPVPTVASAEIENDCSLDITMMPWSSNGFDHGPMSAIDKTKVTVKYDGTPQSEASSSSISGNVVSLVMGACPTGGQTVTFDATYGWCEDSANIGGSEADINARCLAVTGQAVSNFVSGGAPSAWTINDCRFWLPGAGAAAAPRWLAPEDDNPGGDITVPAGGKIGVTCSITPDATAVTGYTVQIDTGNGYEDAPAGTSSACGTATLDACLVNDGIRSVPSDMQTNLLSLGGRTYVSGCSGYVQPTSASQPTISHGSTDQCERSWIMKMDTDASGTVSFRIIDGTDTAPTLSSLSSIVVGAGVDVDY